MEWLWWIKGTTVYMSLFVLYWPRHKGSTLASVIAFLVSIWPSLWGDICRCSVDIATPVVNQLPPLCTFSLGKSPQAFSSNGVSLNSMMEWFPYGKNSLWYCGCFALCIVLYVICCSILHKTRFIYKQMLTQFVFMLEDSPTEYRLRESLHTCTYRV